MAIGRLRRFFDKRTARFVTTFLLVILSSAAVPVDELVLTVDDVVGPAASLKSITVRFAPGGGARIAIGEAHLFGQYYTNVAIVCAALDFARGKIDCAQGKLMVRELAGDLAFTYVTTTRRLDLALTTSSGERWNLSAVLDDHWRADLDVAGGLLSRFAPLLPKAAPLPTKGTITGKAKLAGSGAKLSNLAGDLRLADLAFSDAAGLRAGDKLAGSLTLKAERKNDLLRWQGSLAWDSGEIFWSPLYFPTGGHRLDAAGTLRGDALTVEHGTLRLKGVGEAGFALVWDLNRGLTTLDAGSTGLDVNDLYTLLLKPMLNKNASAQFTVSGKVDAGLRYADSAIQQVDLTLGDLTLTDANDRYAIDRLNGTIPWRRTEQTQAKISIAGAQLFGVPIGAFEAPVKLRGFDVDVDEVAVPVLDGKFLIKDVQATRQDENWRWQFGGVLLPVSMEALTGKLDLPLMHGALSATIPKVAYERGRVAIEGGIGIRVFDGDVAITDMSLLEPLGLTPRLYADVEMRNVDLALLTSTFKFGSVEGRVDVDFKGLELANWRPVKFDARIESSPGDYRKKISQQAVQNITALGGAGAAAAIERSFLRFFDEFGYRKLGLSCRLRDNVCEMSGIASTPDGYIIVEGGGIPAITVKGYNHRVSWSELLDRLQRVIQGNVQPIIK